MKQPTNSVVTIKVLMHNCPDPKVAAKILRDQLQNEYGEDSVQLKEAMRTTSTKLRKGPTISSIVY